MNKETMWEAMEHLAPDLIEEADRPAAPRRRRSWSKTLLIAAAACLVLAVGVVAADALFGLKILEFANDGENNRLTFQAVEVTQFPVSQFGETIQEYIENGMPEVGRRPADYVAEGYYGYVITFDIPTFDTWAEAADFIGADIPLAEESSVLSQGVADDFCVRVSANVVSLSALYLLDGQTVSCSVDISVQGGGPAPTYSNLFGGSKSAVTQQQTVTGSGADTLIYTVDGEAPSCSAYFIREGILYSIILRDTSDTALMEEILASF